MKFSIIKLLIFALILGSCSQKERITLISTEDANNRVEFGKKKLEEAFTKAGFDVQNASPQNWNRKGKAIALGTWENDIYADWLSQNGFDPASSEKPGKEGFQISSKDQLMAVRGADGSGALYGAIDLANRVKKEGELDFSINRRT